VTITNDHRACAIDGCESRSRSRGWCNSHYQRWLNHGDPTAGRASRPRSTPEERFWSKVDKSEGCWEWTSTKLTGERGGYGRFWFDGAQRLSHRFSYELVVGPIPDGMSIDHACHNRGCVRPDHLRPATHKQNVENLAAGRKNNASGVRGVSWARNERKWRAEVRHDRRAYYLGYFTNLAEAEAVVIAKRNELFTHNDADRIAS